LKYTYKHIVICCIISVVLLLSTETKAVEKSVNDTIVSSAYNDALEAKDTTRVHGLPKEYQTLKEQSSKNRWTKRLFSLLVRESTPPDQSEENKSMVDEFKPFEGKIIRNINITVLSPFGTDIQNPEISGDEFKLFNNAHAQTRESTIKSIIQFRRGKPVNAAIMTTSEAQLRSTSYINDARISVQPIETTNDSVDVNIIVRDKWTIGVDLHSLSSSKVDIEVFDRNILGTGNRIGLNFIHSNKYDRKFGYGASYLYENVAHTNIDLEASYLDKITSTELSLSAKRALQPKFKYFGETSYLKNIIRTDIAAWDSITPDYNEKFSVTIGRAYTLSDDDVIRRLVLSFRFKMKSPEYKDSNYQDHINSILLPYKYTKNKLWLVQLSLYQNSYMREYMIYNFGTTEDVAQGYNISAQLGYSSFENIKNGVYTSLSASYGSSEILNGNIYVSSSISSFFNEKEAFGGVFKFDTRYFTPLIRMGSLRFRQFLTLNYSKLLHPDRYFGDRIYMGEHTTLKMKDWRNGRKGAEQLLFKTETDVFSNYEIAGFRFLFYNFLDMGWISQKGNLFSGKNFNYGLGLGIRVRNNFIVFNTIDIKIGYYPKLEQDGVRSFFKVSSSTPDIPPNFVPTIPSEITLE